MPRLSLGLGVQAVSKVKGAVAPSGIPASTQTVIITNNADFNGTYSRLYSGYWEHVEYSVLFIRLLGSWSINDSDASIELNNPSSDANYIPTTGWTRNGEPVTITLTAA
jgi:hypothetical protein